ncbi:twin-arginine translocation signal domain-containing protein [Vibrio maerlii]|uniref:twin-arginine translocation signal domain-containing protein n=1 Tax=Vibrio maerlii TaxID=2231648 RepID=UPI000E3D0836|nr:twin-arginine translocation signal domain-containing protein [Vibrio maerlii]
MKEKKVDTSRRELLKGLTTAAVAGTVVASVGNAAAQSDDKPVEVKADKQTGYRETQHIRDYYDTL